MSTELIPELNNKEARKSSPPNEITKVCSEIKLLAATKDCTCCCSQSPLLVNDVGIPFYLRGFLIGSTKGKKASSPMILILVEKVILKRTLDFMNLKKEFDLTNREVEVLRFLCMGLTNKELAVKLSIGENTVKDYMKKLMRKCGASSRISLVTNLH